MGISETVGRQNTVRNTVQAGRGNDLAKVGRTAFLLGGLIMSVIAIIYFASPHTFLSLITLKSGQQPVEVMTMAAHLLLIAGILQIFDCLQNIGIGALRGLGQAQRGFWITVGGYWIIGLPATWFFGIYQNLGATGIWTGLVIGVGVTACMMVLAFEYFIKARDNTVLQMS